MMRRSFIKTAALAAAGTAVLGSPASAMAGKKTKKQNLSFAAFCTNKS